MTGADFRPMDELSAEGRHVEMLMDGGNIVVGWLFCGMPSTPRSFWTRDRRGSVVCISPVGWRECQSEERAAA